MATSDEVKEHRGVEFSIVSQGLAEDEVVSFVDSLMDQADKEAQEVVAKARNDAEAIIGPVREKVSSMEAEAKLEAKYIVRRFTVKFVEELRSVITDTSNKMLPSLDDLMKESGHGSILEDEKDSKKAISSSGGKAKDSSKE